MILQRRNLGGGGSGSGVSASSATAHEMLIGKSGGSYGWASGFPIFTSDPAYSLACDGATLVDGTIAASSNLLNSASANFGTTYGTADVGKTIVVNGAGAAIATATLSGALTTGSPITTIPVTALAKAFPQGPVVLVNGANTQTFQTIGAVSGATTIPVTSQTPTFAYPTAGTTVSSYGAPLITTISAVNSATQVQLTASATSTTTTTNPSMVVYGTDNSTGLQSAISDAETGASTLVITTGPGEGYLHTQTLTVNTSLTIKGLGSRFVYGSAPPQWLMPATAPYIQGSVLICAGSNDAIQLTGSATSHQFEDFGVRYANAFQGTGHAINGIPPILTSTFHQKGVFNCDVARVKVWGHDGAHYAFQFMNEEYVTFLAVGAHGGGSIHLSQNDNTGWQFGNIECLFGNLSKFCTGSTAAVQIDNVSGSVVFNMFTWVAPQINTSNLTFLVFQGIQPCSASEFVYNTSGLVDKVTWIAPQSGNNAGGINFALAGSAATGHGQVVGGGVFISPAWSVTPTNITQNQTGSMRLYLGTWDLLPSPNVTSDVQINASSASNMSGQFLLSEESMQAGSVPVTTTTNGTISGTVTTVPVPALAAAIADGVWFTVVNGTTQQQFQCNGGAAAAATTIPVHSTTSVPSLASGSSIYMAVRRTLQGWVVPSFYFQTTATNAKLISQSATPIAGST